MSEDHVAMEPILDDEWKYLIDPPGDYRKTDNFIAQKVELSAYSESCPESHRMLLSTIELVTQVTRLREVRALKGFRRLASSGELVSVNPKGEQWLPAIENFGEGVFIQFKRSKFEAWIDGQGDTIKCMLQKLNDSYIQNDLTFLRKPSAIYIMMHTLSHLIIRQIAFESGYAVASVNERIYANGDHQAGVLIYTAGAGADGSLGGLVEQGLPERLVPLILASLEKADWCSNDPICREIPGQGTYGLNEAACHACTLLPETSCEMYNLLLNRNLIVQPGFYSDVLVQKRKEM